MAYSSSTSRQIRYSSSVPATSGPSALPTVEPKLWMDMENALRSENRRDSDAMAGRCHSDPGMEIRITPMISMPQFGDSPITTKAMTFSTMQTVSISPQWARKRSTSTPEPVAIRPFPLVRMASRNPVCRVLRARVLAMAVRKTGKPRS